MSDNRKMKKIVKMQMITIPKLPIPYNKGITMKKVLLLALTLSTVSLWGMKCEKCPGNIPATYKITYTLKSPSNTTYDHYGCAIHQGELFEAMDHNQNIINTQRMLLPQIKPAGHHPALIPTKSYVWLLV